MLICSAEQSHERVRQLPHPDPSGGQAAASCGAGAGERATGGGTIANARGGDTLCATSKGPFRVRIHSLPVRRGRYGRDTLLLSVSLGIQLMFCVVHT